MGMSVEDYSRSTLRQIFNRIRGYNERISEVFRQDWERARMQAIWCMAPMVSRLPKPTDLIVFPWEVKQVSKELNKGDIRKMIEEGMDKNKL